MTDRKTWCVPILAWAVYAAVYFGRINLSIAIPFLQNEAGYSKAALGFLASGFFGAYAIGQFINGIIGDRLPVKYFVSLGLIVAGITNILFGMIQAFPVMFIVWTVNGYFQSMLWGPLLRTLSESAPRAKQYRVMFIMSTSPVIGHFLSYILVGRLAVSFGWSAAFLVPGIMLSVMAGLWFWGISRFGGKTESQSETETLSKREVLEKPNLIGFILQNKLYIIIFVGILAGIVKEGLTLWGPAIFTGYFSLNMNRMLSVMSLMPLVNLLFVILVGILYKKFIQNENRIILIFSLTALLSILLMWRLQTVIFLLTVIFFYGLMASINATCNILTAYIPFNYKRHGRVSAVAGILDSSIYFGAVIAGPVIGITAEKFGWNGIFGGILWVCAATLVLCLFMRKPLRN